MCSKTNALGVKKIAIVMLLALTLTSCTNTENKDTQKNTKKSEVKTEAKKDEVKSNKIIVSKGDTITVTYTGSTTDGKIFDASSKHPGQPLTFIAGAGQMIHGFDAGVIGMKLGEAKTLNISAKDAYGETDVLELKDADLKAIEEQGGLKASDIKVGDNAMPKTGGILKIVEIKDGKYFAKHPNPLAGKDLIFEVKIESIK